MLKIHTIKLLLLILSITNILLSQTIDSTKIFLTFGRAILSAQNRIQEYSLVDARNLQSFFYNGVISAPSDSIIIHLDLGDSLTINSPQIFANISPDNQNTWYSNQFSPILLPGFENTWGTMLSIGVTDHIYWYIQASLTLGNSPPTIITQAPKNYDDLFPPPLSLYCPVVDEITGDVVDNIDFLDITVLEASYSNEKVYIRMSMAEGGFPPGEFFGPWYLYGAGLSNPDSDPDSETQVIYALGYGEGAFGMLDPGLIKLTANSDDEVISFEYVTEDIDYLIDGQNLYLSVDINYLIEDPDFGVWPNDFDGLAIAGMTVSADINQDFTFYDGTSTGLFIMQTGFQEGNQLPEISDPYFDPGLMKINIHYSDQDNNLAVVRSMDVSGISYDLIPDSHEYSSLVLFSVEAEYIEYGNHTAVFHFSDGADEVADTLYFFFDPDSCMMMGDVNEDGVLDVTDIIGAVSIILNCGENDCYQSCADLDANQVIDILDIVLIVQLYLNL